MDYFIRLPKKKDTKIIYDKITELIGKQFEKLNMMHKNILIKYLYRVVLIGYFYFYNDNFIEQLYLNNYQDIFSFLVLLLPYYELNNSKNITSLDELFINLNSKAKSLSSSYYIDHLDFGSESDYLEKYFTTTINLIIQSFSKIHCSLLPNWINIFPYTMETYKESNIYKNFAKIYKEKRFEESDTNIMDLYSNEDYTQLDIQQQIYDKFLLLGYSKLYGVIHNFMFKSIVPIKWIIYDINDNNKQILPNIIYLTTILKINNIANNSWDKLSEKEKNEKIELWENFYKSDKCNKICLKSLVLFYLKWEKDNDNLTELKLSKKCLEIIQTNIEDIDKGYNEDDVDENKIYNDIDYKINECLKKIYPKITFERIYTYIYESIQQFKYTWYGYVCMDDEKNLLNEKDFFNKYFNTYKEIEKEAKKSANHRLYYLTPKNIYNYCKSLLHNNLGNSLYIIFSDYSEWNNVVYDNQKIFVSRLNNKDTNNWFNIKINIARTYQLNPDTDKNKINEIMNGLKNFLTNNETFVDIIFQTMVYNGIFTYFKYNPKLTDTSILPDKNKNYDNWKKYILSKVDIDPYSKSYHPFSNTMLKTEIYPNINTMKQIKNSMWYTNFGANWIAQIQLYHHYLNNRVLYITGATGAGKSTLTPFLLVYAVKILKYKNNAKVVCTQPRTQPVKDNSKRMAESIGYPINFKKDNKLDNSNENYKKTNISEGVPQDINYIQYKHMKGTLTDDLYHPYLRLYTDGSLYNIIKQSYMFKKTIPSLTNTIPEFTNQNLFDVILVDEAHEHNTNMDLILTVSKFATYINNQVSLGIISATMDDDELIYRKYYEPIDDNWKAPLTAEKLLLKYNKNYIDRRIHLSIPFGGMNFEVAEYPNDNLKYPKDVETFTDMKKINTRVKEVLKHILKTTQNDPGKNDILIFQPGESDIKKLLKEINEETHPNVLAIPFYSSLDRDILENVVKNIQKDDVRKKLRYPKNKYDISQMDNIPSNELLPEGTYNKFVILATNIAEASITIDSLTYVIDIGNQKINNYDYNTNQSKLETIPIAIPNQKQRKGRVGRVKPGNVFYTYDRFGLSEKVPYKLNNENISSFIFDLVSTTDSKIIDANSDPYRTDNYEKFPECIRQQYFIKQFDEFEPYYTFYERESTNKKKNVENIIYPYADGKYKLETLVDENGIFYIIHPNEDYFFRNPLTLEIKSKDKKSNYFNKVLRVFEYGKLTGMVGDNNLLSAYGLLVNSMGDFMEFSENSIDFTKIILDCYSLNLNDKNTFRDIIMFIIFKMSKFSFKKIPIYWTGKSDFLIISESINSNLCEMFSLMDIYDELKPDLTNYNDVVKNKVSSKLFNLNFLSSSDFISINSDTIKSILITYYQIKIKLEIINTNSKYFLKKEFDKIFDILKDNLELKNNTRKLNEPLLKIMKYYIDCDKFMRRNVIRRLLDELKLISDSDASKKLSEQMIKKIGNVINNTSIFEDENLKNVNIQSGNKIYSHEFIAKFNSLSSYDKLCFVIIKNFTQNVLIKVPHTEFYINYYNSDINTIYSLETIMEKYTRTKVPSDIRNFIIFSTNMNDYNELNNIMVLGEDVVSMLNDYLKSMGIALNIKNKILDEEKAKGIYQDKYPNILKKIDKIIEYISR